ncbi:MAG TPA: shikimate kinase [Mycobacteriales bacterium]|nr:shikimate kinase [Mycobacteriales bacterium]
MSGAEPGARSAGGPVLVLVGPSGAGKTTIGGLVAQRLGVGFRDTDTDVVERAGKPVAEIFVDDGEPAFRALERAAVAAALAEHPGVLALGGGAVLAEETRALLAGHPVVFLSVGLADAVDRIGLNRDRPLLALNPRAQLRAMLAERQPVYEALAAVTVQTDGRAPDEVVDAVLAALGAAGAAPGGTPQPGRAPR